MYFRFQKQAGNNSAMSLSSLSTRIIYCSLCDEEIDAALGYYACAVCKEDYCPICALSRDIGELEMAENPYMVPSTI